MAPVLAAAYLLLCQSQHALAPARVAADDAVDDQLSPVGRGKKIEVTRGWHACSRLCLSVGGHCLRPGQALWEWQIRGVNTPTHQRAPSAISLPA